MTEIGNRSTGTGHPLAVVAGLIRVEGRWLIARRAATDPLGAVWEFPGGTVESGETPAAALGRELREELGVEVEVGELVTEVSHEYPHLWVQIMFFRCRIITGEPQGLEGQEIAWRSQREMAQLPFPAADEPVLALLPDLI